MSLRRCLGLIDAIDAEVKYCDRPITPASRENAEALVVAVGKLLTEANITSDQRDKLQLAQLRVEAVRDGLQNRQKPDNDLHMLIAEARTPLEFLLKS